MPNQFPNTQTRHRPDTEQSNAPAREIPRGQVANNWKPTADDRPRFEVRKAKEIEWAERHLPGEHLTFVVTAMDMLKLNKQPVSVNSVMARLESTGRTMAQLKQKGWA